MRNIFCFGLGLLLLAGCNQQPAVESIRGEDSYSSPGEKLFVNNCAGCHGLNGSGNPSMMQGRVVDFKSKAWQKMHTDTQIKATILQGKGMMPAFETVFTEAELNELITYIRSMPKQSL